MDRVKILTTLEEARVFSDPYRYRILNNFYEINEPATAKQVADRMEEVPAKIHYHVKKLEKSGILKLVYTKEINGIIAKYYEPTARNFEVSYNKTKNDDKTVVLSESQKIISGVYDTSKNIILDQLKKCTKNDEKIKATFTMEDVYLSEKEAEEFQRYIKDFFENHIDKLNESDKLYHCFFSIGKMQ